MTLLFFSCLCAAKAGDRLTFCLTPMECKKNQPTGNKQSDSTHTNSQHKEASISCLQVGCVLNSFWLCCQLTSSGMDAAFELVCVPTAPTTTGGKTPPGKEAGSCETTGRQRGNGNERQRRKGLPHSSTFTPCCCCCCWLPLLSLRLPSPPGWACQPSERQSDMSSAAGYQGLIKAGWHCRIQPKSRRALLDESRLCFVFAECLWLEVISCIIREMLRKVSPYSLVLGHYSWLSSTVTAGSTARRKRWSSCWSWSIRIYLSRKTNISATLTYRHIVLASLYLLMSGVRGQ